MHEDKVKLIAGHFYKIMEALGLDLEDPSLKKTPERYAKMLTEQLFSGLNPKDLPRINTERNDFDYSHMLIHSHISMNSICEHHFVPFLGYCHIAYVPKESLIGLSKLNQIVHHFSRRPQLQERMTNQIGKALISILETEDVAIVVDALHLCVRMSGIEDSQAITRTLFLNGAFLQPETRQEFIHSIPSLREFKV